MDEDEDSPPLPPAPEVVVVVTSPPPAPPDPPVPAPPEPVAGPVDEDVADDEDAWELELDDDVVTPEPPSDEDVPVEDADEAAPPLPSSTGNSTSWEPHAATRHEANAPRMILDAFFTLHHRS